MSYVDCQKSKMSNSSTTSPIYLEEPGDPPAGYKNVAQDCPLALLAQTCSKIQANVQPSFLRTSSSTSSPPTTKRSLVKIAPRPAQEIAFTPFSGKFLLPLDKTQQLKQCKVLPVLNPNVVPFQGAQNAGTEGTAIQEQCSNNEKSGSTNPKIVQLIQACKSAVVSSQINSASPCIQRPLRPQATKGKVALIGPFSTLPPNSPVQLQTVKMNLPTKETVVNVMPNDLPTGSASRSDAGVKNVKKKIIISSPLPITVTPNASDFNVCTVQTNTQQQTSGEIPPSFINIMQPDALTGKMLQVIPPQEQMSETLHKVVVDSPADKAKHIEYCEFRESQVPGDATVQITVPPNATPERLQQILLLAAHAAQKYQTVRKMGTMVIKDRCSPLGAQIPRSNSNTQINESQKVKIHGNTGGPGRKIRTPCTCSNCVKLKSYSSKPGEKRQHVCWFENCQKEFNKTSHLRAHIRKHTGERPYACNHPFCDRKFTRSDELLRHRRTHGGVKKFACNICSKRFMRSDHLTKHKKTHQKTHLQRSESIEPLTIVA